MCFSQDADVIVTDLASAIKQIFPTVPLKYIIRKVIPSIPFTHTIYYSIHCNLQLATKQTRCTFILCLARILFLSMCIYESIVNGDLCFPFQSVSVDFVVATLAGWHSAKWTWNNIFRWATTIRSTKCWPVWWIQSTICMHVWFPWHYLQVNSSLVCDVGTQPVQNVSFGFGGVRKFGPAPSYFWSRRNRFFAHVFQLFSFEILTQFYRDEVAWDIDTIYLSHDTRILNLRDFDHLEPK